MSSSSSAWWQKPVQGSKAWRGAVASALAVALVSGVIGHWISPAPAKRILTLKHWVLGSLCAATAGFAGQFLLR